MNPPVQNPRRGATAAGTSWRQRFESYREHHREVAGESLRRLLVTPLPTLMTLLVIAIALSLPAGLFVLLKNVQAVSAGWEGSARISLYLRQQVASEPGRALATELAKRADVKDTTYISREQALAEFQEQSGLGDLLKELDENPLPAVILVNPAHNDMQLVEKLRADLARMEAVDIAQLDAQWVQRLYAMLELGQRLVVVLGIALALAVLLVIVNTIRLSIEARRDEILIVKLVGGTDAFVRRPFLYTGFWYGLGGSLLALLQVQLVLWWLDEPVQVISDLYRSEFQLVGLGFDVSLLMLGGSVLIGLVGARLAVGQHLRAYEPR
jgi:cell division transport system permease protein